MYNNATLVATPRVASHIAIKQRFVAIDLLRGIAIVLMALDHVAHFTGTRMQAEFYNAIPFEIEHWPHLLSGLMTNIAAPTFWVLSGVSVALLASSERMQNARQGSLTRFLWVRSLVLIVLDLTLVNMIWHHNEVAGPIIFGVLSSIGVSLLLLSLLRFLPQRLLLMLSLGLLAVYPFLVSTFPLPASHTPWQAVLLHFSSTTNPTIWFPIFGWWGLLGLGYCLGLSIHTPRWRRSSTWLMVGGALMILWLLIRLTGGYGTFTPYHEGQPPIFFVLMSKAPPGLDYLAFNLGIASFIFAVILMIPWIGGATALKPFVWMGQTPLFVYVTHLLIFRILGILVMHVTMPGLVRGYIVWAIGLIPLSLLAFIYRSLRRRYPDSWLRYF